MTEIEDQWRWLLARRDLKPMVLEMIAAAHLRIALHRLFPYLSLERTLKFSETTEYPYSQGVPFVRYVDPESDLDGPGYEVRDADLRPTRFLELQAALDFLIDRLPPGR